MEHHKYGSDPEGLYRDWLEEKAAQSSCIAEVGVLAGTTTLRMAKATSGSIWAVDHWKGVPGDPVQSAIYKDPSASERLFRRRLKPWIDSGRVTVVKMGSARAAAHLMEVVGPEFDLIFIDADHSYKAVKRDVIHWRKLVKHGGILCGHDIGWPGVRKAVDQEVPGWEAGPGTLWWTRIRRAGR